MEECAFCQNRRNKSRRGKRYCHVGVRTTRQARQAPGSTAAAACGTDGNDVADYLSPT